MSFMFRPGARPSLGAAKTVLKAAFLPEEVMGKVAVKAAKAVGKGVEKMGKFFRALKRHCSVKFNKRGKVSKRAASHTHIGRNKHVRHISAVLRHKKCVTRHSPSPPSSPASSSSSTPSSSNPSRSELRQMLKYIEQQEKDIEAMKNMLAGMLNAQ